jgi:hypothetical protein
MTGRDKDEAKDPSLEELNHLPDVKELVSSVLVFRAKIALEDASDKSPESKFPSPAKFSLKPLILRRDFFRLL